MSIKYEMIIYWSEEDGSFVVEVPELAGCMADGETYELALSNAKRVVHEWMETAREIGREIPEPKGRLFYAWLARSADVGWGNRPFLLVADRRHIAVACICQKDSPELRAHLELFHENHPLTAV